MAKFQRLILLGFVHMECFWGIFPSSEPSNSVEAEVKELLRDNPCPSSLERNFAYQIVKQNRALAENNRTLAENNRTLAENNRTLAEKNEIIYIQNCSVVYRDAMSLLENKYMSAAFIQKNPKYREIHDSFLIASFRERHPDLRRCPVEDLKRNKLFQYYRKYYRQDLWREAQWLVFFTWVIESPVECLRSGNGKLEQVREALVMIRSMDPEEGIPKLITCLLSLWEFSTNWVKPDRVDFGTLEKRKDVLAKLMSLECETENIANMCARFILNITEQHPITSHEREEYLYGQKWHRPGLSFGENKTFTGRFFINSRSTTRFG